ncbi:hypothetical protein M3Y99_01978000 [Aphelenchoides fujianensis]|nr:hypothetical protein M3Y99_01978000 [Aphelenchoides fujianensis]
MSAFKAVIFDMGGVLIRFLDPLAFDRFLEVINADKEKRKRFMDVEKGEKVLTDALDVYSIVYPDLKDVEDFEGASLEDFSGQKNTDMLEIVRRLKAHGFKVGLLTNNFFWSNARKRSAVIKEADEFDAVVESCRVGFRKPERHIFEIMAEKLGVQLKECVFIDDWEKNVQGARAAGLAGIFLPHDNTTSAIRELESLLGVSLH